MGGNSPVVEVQRGSRLFHKTLNYHQEYLLFRTLAFGVNDQLFIGRGLLKVRGLLRAFRITRLLLRRISAGSVIKIVIAGIIVDDVIICRHEKKCYRCSLSTPAEQEKVKFIGLAIRLEFKYIIILVSLDCGYPFLPGRSVAAEPESTFII